MSESEAIKNLKAILNECTESEESVCYVTSADAPALEMAIQALEKQIPKKVITPPCNTCNKELCDCECEHFAVTYRDDYRCPTCDSNGVYMQEYELRFDCCPNCGQKLDWSDKE